MGGGQRKRGVWSVWGRQRKRGVWSVSVWGRQRKRGVCVCVGGAAT